MTDHHSHLWGAKQKLPKSRASQNKGDRAPGQPRGDPILLSGDFRHPWSTHPSPTSFLQLKKDPQGTEICLRLHSQEVELKHASDRTNCNGLFQTWRSQPVSGSRGRGRQQPRLAHGWPHLWRMQPIPLWGSHRQAACCNGCLMDLLHPPSRVPGQPSELREMKV